MEKRFRSLRVIASVFKVLAWIALVLGIIGGLIMMVTGLAGGLLSRSSTSGDLGPGLGLLGGLLSGFFGGVAVIVMALLYFLFLYAAGDAISLALAIEENTREVAIYLKGGDAYRRMG